MQTVMYICAVSRAQFEARQVRAGACRCSASARAVSRLALKAELSSRSACTDAVRLEESWESSVMVSTYCEMRSRALSSLACAAASASSRRSRHRSCTLLALAGMLTCSQGFSKVLPCPVASASSRRSRHRSCTLLALAWMFTCSQGLSKVLPYPAASASSRRSRHGSCAPLGLAPVCSHADNLFKRFQGLCRAVCCQASGLSQVPTPCRPPSVGRQQACTHM